MIQTQKLQKLHRQERQGRQLSLFSELLYRRVYNDHETATWNMSESTSFGDIMPDILSSSVHGRKFERTVLTFKKMSNFSTGCRQRHGEVKKAWAVLLICCQDYPTLNYTSKDLTHLLSRSRIFENLWEQKQLKNFPFHRTNLTECQKQFFKYDMKVPWEHCTRSPMVEKVPKTKNIQRQNASWTQTDLSRTRWYGGSARHQWEAHSGPPASAPSSLPSCSNSSNSWD